MLAWIRSPRGSTATATVVAVILALFWLAPWQQPLPAALRFPFVTSGSPTAPSGPDAAMPASIAAADPSHGGGSPPARAAAGSTSSVAALTPADPTAAIAGRAGGMNASAAATSAPDTVPSFDVVRVEPTGEAVIAGRAAAGSEVTLLDGDTVIGHVLADAGGQFAFVPPPLTGGNHDLSLRTQHDGQAPVRSAQGVAIVVASSGTTKPLVALLSPDQPAEILSDGITPAATSAPRGATAVPDPAKVTGRGAAGTSPAPVSIQSVQAGQNGNFLAAGVAHPGSQCRVYLNGAYLADVTAGQDGKWSVEIKKGMKPGRYTVRADELDPAGTVSHRAEVPFDYPTAMAGRSPGGAKRLLLSRRAPDPSLTTGTALPTVGSGGAASVTTAGPGADTVALAAAGRRLASGSGGNAAAMAVGAPGLLASATPPSSPAAAVVPDLHTTTVIRGDSLWRISRKMLGHGIQYTEIYATNTSQIRDPALIYPGQIFVVPSKRPNG